MVMAMVMEAGFTHLYVAVLDVADMKSHNCDAE